MIDTYLPPISIVLLRQPGSTTMTLKGIHLTPLSKHKSNKYITIRHQNY